MIPSHRKFFLSYFTLVDINIVNRSTRISRIFGTWRDKDETLTEVEQLKKQDGMSEKSETEIIKPKNRNIPASTIFSFLKLVKWDKLDENERRIHLKHLEALKNEEDTYKDPVTGYVVLTRLAHLRRGECCGNACRHCPYDHKNVPFDLRPKKKFNSSFFL